MASSERPGIMQDYSRMFVIHRASPFLAVLAVVSTVTLACSSGNGEGTGSDANKVSGATTNATNCPTWTQPLDAYGGPSVTHDGSAHSFRFELLDSSPISPPTPGDMNWTLKILDANNQPVKDAKISELKTWMPQHSHGSTARPVPMSNGDGTYTIDQLYLFMPGVWQVTVGATSGSTTDSAVFTFCLGT